jgi:hypothetical protein
MEKLLGVPPSHEQEFFGLAQRRMRELTLSERPKPEEIVTVFDMTRQRPCRLSCAYRGGPLCKNRKTDRRIVGCEVETRRHLAARSLPDG